jgi:high-affinity K+ transport system ATPase subunit B
MDLGTSDRGVRYRAVGATALLRRNLLVYGVVA